MSCTSEICGTPRKPLPTKSRGWQKPNDRTAKAQSTFWPKCVLKLPKSIAASLKPLARFVTACGADAARQSALADAARISAELQRRIADSTRERTRSFERAAAACAAGKIDEGIALFLRAYEKSPPVDPLRTSTRRLMAAWQDRLGLSLFGPSQNHALAFDPNGQVLLTGGGDFLRSLGMTQVWDVAAGKMIGETRSKDGGVHTIVIGRGGVYATASGLMMLGITGGAHVWDIATGKLICSTPPQPSGIISLAISPDGKTLATAGVERAAHLWDAKTGKPIGAPLENKDMVSSLAFSPDGKKLLTGGADKTARLWDATTGKPLSAPIQVDEDAVFVGFTARGDAFFAGTREFLPRRARKPGVVQIWDTETLKPKCECSETDGRLEAVSFSPDGRSIAIAGGDTAWIYETEHGDRVVGPMRHAKNINALAYSPNGTMIATASEDETPRLWDTENGKPIGGPIFHAGDVEAVAFSPDGQTLATADFNGLCRLQNLPRPPLIYAKRNTHENVPFATLSPDGRVGSRSTTMSPSYTPSSRTP